MVKLIKVRCPKCGESEADAMWKGKLLVCWCPCGHVWLHTAKQAPITCVEAYK